MLSSLNARPKLRRQLQNIEGMVPAHIDLRSLRRDNMSLGITVSLWQKYLALFWTVILTHDA